MVIFYRANLLLRSNTHFSFTANMVVYIYFYRTELQTDHGEASLENDASTISIPYSIYHISYIFFKLHCRAPYSRIFSVCSRECSTDQNTVQHNQQKRVVTADMYVSFCSLAPRLAKVANEFLDEWTMWQLLNRIESESTVARAVEANKRP